MKVKDIYGVVWYVDDMSYHRACNGKTDRVLLTDPKGRPLCEKKNYLRDGRPVVILKANIQEVCK